MTSWFGIPGFPLRGSTDVIVGDSWGCPVGTRQQGNNIGGRVQAAGVDWCGGDSFGRVRALCDVSKGILAVCHSNDCLFHNLQQYH